MNLGKSNPSRVAVPLPFLVIFGLIIVVGGYAIGVLLTPIIFPPEASAEAHQVDELFRILLIIGGAIFLLVEGLLLYSVLRFRAEPGDTTDGPSIHGNATLEIVWTAIPSVIVLVLVVLSYQVWVDIRQVRAGENLVNGDEVPIHVTAQRFAWTFAYNTPVPDKDGNPIVIKSGTLYTYVGQRVHLTMDANDVIHSFWVPAMRVKQDLIPGRTTEIRFTPVLPPTMTESDFPLTFPIRCAELCGGGHGGMTSQVVIYANEEEFLNAFYNVEIENALHPPADPVLRGQQILASGAYPCANCHTLSALGWTGSQAPNLNGVGDRALTRRDGYTAEEYFRETLRDPQAFVVPGYSVLMPPFQSTDPAEKNYMPDTDMWSIIGFLCSQSDSGAPTCTIDPALIGAEAPTAEATAEATGEATQEATPQAEATGEATAEATAAG